MEWLRTMNPALARSLFFFVVWPAGTALIFAIGLATYEFLALRMFPWTFLVLHWAGKLRCPKCGARVRGIEIPAGWWESAFTSDVCADCGRRFSSHSA